MMRERRAPAGERRVARERGRSGVPRPVSGVSLVSAVAAALLLVCVLVSRAVVVAAALLRVCALASRVL